MSITERIAKWREMPVLPIQYKSSQSPYKENTQILWHMGEACALRDRLRDTAAVLEECEQLPELNLSNYTHADVEELNEMVSAFVLGARAILARLAEDGLVGSQEDKT